MKIFANLATRFKALTASSGALEAFAAVGGGFFGYPRNSQYVNGAYQTAQSASYGLIYSSQENVRIVVDAIARHATKRALKCYGVDGKGAPEEDPLYEAAATLREPNDFQSQRQLLKQFILDKLIYEDAFLWDMGPVENGRRFLLRIPPPAMAVETGSNLKPAGYTIWFANGSNLPLKPKEVIHWSGYNPSSNSIGISKLETLRVLLTENAVRKAHTIDMIRGGLIKGGIVRRPIEAPEWSPTARRRFESNFASRLRGVSRGEVAMLEDGMDFMEAGITPQQAELLQSKQFDLDLTASIYGVNPGLFSKQGNLAQAREQMEEDVVEELVQELGDILTLQLIRTIYGDEEHYFKFSRAQITDLSTLFEAGSKATGGSVLTQNEFRHDYMDKPPLDGGDTLISHPGSQQGSLPPAPGAPSRGQDPVPVADLGAEATVKAIELALEKKNEERGQQKAMDVAFEHLKDKSMNDHVAILSKHFRRQKAAHETGQLPAINQTRWNRELASDLRKASEELVTARANQVAKELKSVFDPAYVQNYLTASADILAQKINQSTLDDVRSAMSKGASIEVAYEARVSRAPILATSRVTQLMSFATLEAARQSEE